MKSRNPGRVLGAALGLCAVLLQAAMPAWAQRPPLPDRPVPPEQKVGKSPDPHNLEGVWYTRGYDRTYRQLDRSEPPFNPAGRTEWLRHIQAEKDGNPIGDAPTRCYPHGVPRLVASPYPIQIIQTPGMLTILHEVGHNIRYVYMDQDHPKNPKLSFLGHSVGHWDGDTLVVDTIGFNDRTRIDEEGITHSLKLHMVERYRKINEGQVLENIMTIEDPEIFTKTWQARRNFDWRPDLRLSEYICEENNRNVPNAQGFTTAK
jgi:hypothetical protein